MTKPAPFTEASVRRAISAARKEGASAISIRPDGTITVHLVEVPLVATAAPDQNAPASDWEDIRA